MHGAESAFDVNRRFTLQTPKCNPPAHRCQTLKSPRRPFSLAVRAGNPPESLWRASRDKFHSVTSASAAAGADDAFWQRVPVMMRQIRVGVCVLVIFLLQVTLVHRFSDGCLRLDLLYVLVAYLALEADFKAALWSAYGIGILRDLASCGRMGASALVCVAGAAALLFVRDHLLREKWLTDALLVFLFLFFCGLLEAGLVCVLGSGPVWKEAFPRLTGQAALSGIMSPLFFFLFDRAGLVNAPGKSAVPRP